MRRTSQAIALVLGLVAAIAAQSNDCALAVRNGDRLTLTADSITPMESMANTLAKNFGIFVNVEEPQYQYVGDYEDISRAAPQWSAEHPNIHYQVPKRRRISIQIVVKKNPDPGNEVEVLGELVRKARVETPFGYLLEYDYPGSHEFVTLVPRTTRDATGTVVPATPLLDRKVDIPTGERTIAESARLMAASLSAQTGLHVSCCQTVTEGIPWGSASVSFGATSEPARQVLEKLILLAEEPETAGGRHYWVLRCDDDWCFIEIAGGGSQCR